MPFTAKSGKFNASIKTVTIGTGDKASKNLLTHVMKMAQNLEFSYSIRI